MYRILRVVISSSLDLTNVASTVRTDIEMASQT
jgi:hypothetical protein